MEGRDGGGPGQRLGGDKAQRDVGCWKGRTSGWWGEEGRFMEEIGIRWGGRREK